MIRVEVKPELLNWACDRSGCDLDALIQRFPKLQAWERGEIQPTFKQLERFASATRTPIGYLFLPEPPIERIPVPDFRTIADGPIGRPSPDLLDTLYLCQQRQEWYRNFAQSMGEARLSFVGSLRMGNGVVRTAALIRRALAFDIDERRHLSTWTEALRRFIEQADALGVLVMVSGVVGSNNRRKLNPVEFRGFALVDPLAPLVFINGTDTKAAQMFTLAHELVHIWIGQSALSDAQVSSAPAQRIERWCNQVAAEFLVPLEAFRAEHDRHAELHSELDRLARHFKVSTLVILRRMRDARSLRGETYWTAYEREVDRLRKLPKSSGGDFYRTLGARAGKRFARALVSSTLEGRSSYTEAFRLLGFKKMATFQELGHQLGLTI